MTRPVSPPITAAAAVLLLMLSTVWGASFFLAEVALTEVPPLTITLHRVAWAVPILIWVVWRQGIAWPRSVTIWGAYLVMGALNNAIPFSLVFWSQKYIESGLASILTGTTAVFGGVVAGLLLRDEPLTLARIVGALLGLAGVAAIMGADLLAGLDPRNIAQLAVLLAALCYALASVWAKVRLSGPPPQMNALGMLMGSTFWMTPAAFIVDGPPSLDLSVQVWVALLGLASFGTAFAYLLYYRILIRAGAANLMLVTLLVPPIAVALGAAFLEETLGCEAWIGFALIALGLVVTDGRLWSTWADRQDGRR
ncbi:DMT family transporter [uncultured Roseovarius sp.]|uniref:DMT family transporter n=1 Tax=uncultured Roseovarius sp. TaxID=293344 RepID=UPI002629DBA7|nr:DMT family transporter [uncultured Roseovarius sp.]